MDIMHIKKLRKNKGFILILSSILNLNLYFKIIFTITKKRLHKKFHVVSFSK